MRCSWLAVAALGLVPGRALAGSPGAEATRHANDRFGQALAVDGDRIAVAAAGANAVGFDAGRVHVYGYSDGQWQLAAQLDNPADEPARGYFGRALALAGDTLVVGAAIEDGFAVDEDARRGAVHVFTRHGAGWRLQVSLADAEVDSDSFGGRLALAGDTLAVLSEARVRARSPLPPQVRVFRRDGVTWAEQARLELSPDNHRPGLGLGDGTLLISAGVATPSILAYRRDGAAWHADPSPALEFPDLRGFVVDGDTALVHHGAASVAVLRDQGGAWSLESTFEFTDETELGDSTLALRGDRAAFRFTYFAGDDREAVAVWRREDTTWGPLDGVDLAPAAGSPIFAHGAMLAVDERWLAVGVPLAPSDEQSGFVSVYASEGGPEVARLSPEDSLAGCDCRAGGGAVPLWAGFLILWVRRRRA